MYQNPNEISNYQIVIKYWLPVFVYAGIIFIQSSFPATQNIPKIPHIDKMLHFIVYAVLGVLVARALNAQRLLEIRKIIVYSIVFTGLYGALDEIHQYFVPFRNADVMDAVADFLGGGFGVFLYVFFGYAQRRNLLMKQETKNVTNKQIM